MTEFHFAIRESAAGILLVEKCPARVPRLVNLLLRWGRSTLALKGSETPGQTLRPILLRHEDLFERRGRGYYDLRNPAEAREDPGVATAARAYDAWRYAIRRQLLDSHLRQRKLGN